MYLTLQLGIKMEVMLPEEDILNLEKGMRKSYKCIVNALVKIDADKASSSYAADREHILATVRKSKGGIDAVNKMVKDFLRGWYLTTLKEIVEKANKTIPTLANSISILVVLSAHPVTSHKFFKKKNLKLYEF